MIYQVFTIRSGQVSIGALIQETTISGGEITVIGVGEEGRGRKFGFLPVQPLNPRDRSIVFAQLGTTKSGIKLFSKPSANTKSHAIVVFETRIGGRGGNSHTGDRKRREQWEDKFWEIDGRKVYPYSPYDEGDGLWEYKFFPFPGKILVEGKVADGAAGTLGSGAQLIAKIPKGVVFRTGYYGRIDGGPSAHYYMFDGEKIMSATWQERLAADLWF